VTAEDQQSQTVKGDGCCMQGQVPVSELIQCPLGDLDLRILEQFSQGSVNVPGDTINAQNEAGRCPFQVESSWRDPAWHGCTRLRASSGIEAFSDYPQFLVIPAQLNGDVDNESLSKIDPHHCMSR
jgi:hypothetical protein